MKKTDKKIISIFLVLIILIAQLMPVMVSAEENGTNQKVTLEEYLIANGVDENEDGKISDEEWKEVKNLVLTNEISDFKGIEKAINLKSLQLYEVNPSTVDFSKLIGLQDLTIYNFEESSEKIDIDLSGLNNLFYLSIDSQNINNIDLSNTNNLEEVIIYSENSSLKLSNSNNTAFLFLEVKDATLDLSNKTRGYVNIKASDYSNIKLPEGTVVEKTYNNGIVCYFSSIEENIYLIENEGWFNYHVQNVVSKNSDIVRVVKEEEYEFSIFAEKPGKTEIIITDALGREIIKKVEVMKNEYIYEEDDDQEDEENENEIEIEIDTTLENTGITAEFCKGTEYNILKSNGELWEAFSWSDEAEIIDRNVKKFIAEGVYVDSFGYVTYGIENTLYNNGKLKVYLDSYDEIFVEYDDVIDVDKNVFLKSNGDLYAIRYSYITEKFYKPQFITDNVKKIVGDFFVKNDNSAWFSEHQSPGYSSHKREYKKIGIYDIKLQLEYCFDFVDSSDVVWEYNYETGKFEKGLKYSKNLNKEFWDCILEDGKFYLGHYDYQESKFIKEKLLLDNVLDINNYDVILRTDGTIWAYDNGKIKKLEPKKKDEYIVSSTIKNKEVEGEKAISGLKVGQTVEDFLKENNFNEECTVKIFDLEDKEITGSEIIGTGTVVKLYNGEELVREFKVIIYGDTDGDGKIDSFDALTLIKLINEKIELKDPVYLEAGKVSGEDKATAFDALTIVKALNGKAEINQEI